MRGWVFVEVVELSLDCLIYTFLYIFGFIYLYYLSITYTSTIFCRSGRSGEAHFYHFNATSTCFGGSVII